MKEQDEKIIYACQDHVDQAIDDYVNFLDLAPRLIISKEEEKCSYCSKEAEYIILK